MELCNPLCDPESRPAGRRETHRKIWREANSDKEVNQPRNGAELNSTSPGNGVGSRPSPM